jgi:hypothetical protein
VNSSKQVFEMAWLSSSKQHASASELVVIVNIKKEQHPIGVGA